MNTNPVEPESNLYQYLSYLFFPVVIFLFGYLSAQFLVPLLVSTDTPWYAASSKWLDPLVVGSFFAACFALSSILPEHGYVQFRHPCPNDHTLALTKVVSATLYSLVASEFILIKVQPNKFTEWDTTLYLVLFPLLILSTSRRFYREYRESSTE